MNALIRPQSPHPTDAGTLTSASHLLELARGRTTDDRRRLLLGIAALCDATPPGAEASPLLGDIFMIIARQAESDIRKALSESLASAEWAPPALIAMLALDEIEIARPVIAASPLLKDQDLLRVLLEATIEHQIEVARRPHISGRVADAIIDRGDPATLTALAGNRTAQVSEDALARLIEHSSRIAALRAPLTRHPRLNDALATQLYQWVGQALREAIGERFRVDETKLAAAVDTVIRPPLAEPRGIGNDDAVVDREEMERRLVAKLQSSGQLRAGFLIRAVRERRLSLFEHAMTALGGFTLDQVRAAMVRPGPDALFLMCAAVGIDRAVFPALLEEVRAMNDGRPGVSQSGEPGPMSLAPTAAARAFRSLMGHVGG
ncbi:DUF2336 domain-containing protein [Brevundimonas sp. AJA228-03]|uniref:DUF2336 domain-containing protein n=1 Tax=Brevundimonas sp. AJA228-03 TaxID=2752515 RepID=UPI001ADF1082|nr:DUF2336 domain-containing protein [Brevundimonas sp. AJA228-03]QTN18994.1 DUF2336 domain-containing protein [Brevundimonas sp. AJA228-03]